VQGVFSYTYPNGVATSFQYDNLNRLASLASSANGTAAASYAYTLGLAGNRTGVTELSGRTVSYGYDTLYMLTSETISGALSGVNGAVSYQYDKVGNRKQRTSTLLVLPTGLWNYDANDRITTDIYDNNGNTIASGGIQDSYDFENHLIGHGFMTFVYDGDGNRVAKTVGGVTTSFLADTNNPTGYAQAGGPLKPSVGLSGVVNVAHAETANPQPPPKSNTRRKCGVTALYGNICREI
jgi:YD repeat-containing protein